MAVLWNLSRVAETKLDPPLGLVDVSDDQPAVDVRCRTSSPN
jgi:hypothetical protein